MKERFSSSSIYGRVSNYAHFMKEFIYTVLNPEVAAGTMRVE